MTRGSSNTESETAVIHSTRHNSPFLLISCTDYCFQRSCHDSRTDETIFTR